MKSLVTLFLTFVSGFMSTSMCPAATIGVNFGPTNSPNLSLAPAESAGAAPFAQTNFNNISASAAAVVLKDNTGVITTATLTTSGVAGFSSNTLATNPDEKLNSGFAFRVGADWSFTIDSIPYATYTILVYDLGRNPGDVKGITIGGTTFYTSSPNPVDPGYLDNNANTPYIYTASTSTNAALPTPQSNYAIFSGLSGGSQTVTVQGSFAREVNGFQIIQVPEPSTCLMISLALPLLLGTRRCSPRTI